MGLLREAFGWYGAAALLLAYALVSSDVVSGESVLYQALNFSGAAGVVVVSLARRAYQPAALNTVWCGIAVVALVTALV